MKPTDRLAAAIYDIDYARANWRAFHTGLADRTADGYPRTASGAQKAPGGAQTLAVDKDTGQAVSVDLTATEAAVIARQRTTDIWEETQAIIAELQGGARRLAKLVANYATVEQPRVGQRCTCSMGHDGSDEWGDPTCQRNAVTRELLSDACRQRRDDWRRRQDVA